MSSSQTLTLWDYFWVLYRYKLRVLAVMILAVILGYLWTLTTPKVFESEAKLFVRVGWENAGLDPTVNKSDAVAVNITRETEITNMLEHLRCRPILERAMDIAMPDASKMTPESRELAFESFKRRLSITSPKQSMIIRIGSKGDTPEQAFKAAHALTTIFMEDHLLLSRPAGSFEFLSQQTDRLREELETAQQELRDAKNRGDLASIQGRRTALESQINSLETRINEVTALLSAADAKMLALKSSIESLPEPLLKQMMVGSPNDGLAAMRDKLFQLQTHQAELKAKYQPSHPLYIAGQAQVDEMSSVLKDEDPDREKIIEAICAAENSNQAGLRAQKQSLQSQLTALRKELATLNDYEIQISKSELKVRHLETQYVNYAKKAEDARIDNALLKDKISNVHVIQPASLPVLPLSSQRAMTLLLFLVCGVVGGVAVALISDQWNRHVKANERSLDSVATTRSSPPRRLEDIVNATSLRDC
ncbi:MAG: hypothetical protein J0M26_28595 [Planctomycetes bacterium]|nr:hypothetical protein [Planctomycetota bacterium]